MVEMKRVLITGAAGFIGSSVADALLQRGDAVIGIDNFTAHYDPRIKRDNIASALANHSYKLYEADVCDGLSMREIFAAERPDSVLHFAAEVGVRASFAAPQQYYSANVLGFHNILEACRIAETGHLILASSCAVYRSNARTPLSEESPVDLPISPYAATKRMNELMAHVHHRAHHLDATILRIFTVYGPRQRPDMAIHRFAQLIDEEKPVHMFGDVSAPREFLYIDDCVNGVLRAIDRPSGYEIFNLGTDETTTLWEVVELVSRHLGKPARIERLPLQPGDFQSTQSSIKKIREMLGYSPDSSIAEGIRRFVEWRKK